VTSGAISSTRGPGTDLTVRAVDAETTTMVVTCSDGDAATVIAMTVSAIIALRA